MLSPKCHIQNHHQAEPDHHAGGGERLVPRKAFGDELGTHDGDHRPRGKGERPRQKTADRACSQRAQHACGHFHGARSLREQKTAQRRHAARPHGKGDAHALGKILHGDAERQQKPRKRTAPARGKSRPRGERHSHRHTLRHVVQRDGKVQESRALIADGGKGALRAGKQQIAPHNERTAQQKADRHRKIGGERSFRLDGGQKQGEEARRDHDARGGPEEHGENALFGAFG